MAAEEVARWLALIERGLRGNEGERLREWLKDKANRTEILNAARLWHGPEILAVLSGLVPAPELVVKKSEGRRHFNRILGWSVLAVCVLLGAGMMTGMVKLPIDETRLLLGRADYATSIG